MNQISKVTEYVEEVFDLYEADKNGFFFVYDDDTFEAREIPLFQFDQIDDATLNKISIALGLSKQEILDMNERAAKKYWEKYPFFRLYKEFLDCWSWYSRFKNDKPTETDLFLDVLFGDGGDICVEERYNYADVKKRLIAKIKEIDSVMPGACHKNADITNLTIKTEEFFSFPQCSEMLRSFIDMVERIEQLFFKAIKTELCEEEANEMNFLATWLHASDIVLPSTLVTYDNVCVYRDVYAEENFSDFFSYVKIKRFIITAPWRCQEFFDDMSLVQKFVNIFPQTKSQMRQFAMDVTRFSCTFVWSDAKPIIYTPGEEQELSDLDLSTPLEERAKECTRIYVEKTDEEMFGSEVFTQRLRNAASPSANGGLELPVREICPVPSAESIARMQKRIAAKIGGNK